MKRFVAVNLPRFEEEKGGKEDEVIEKRYQELEEETCGESDNLAGRFDSSYSKVKDMCTVVA